MKKKSNKRVKKLKKTKKQKMIVMVGCSRKHKHNKSCKRKQNRRHHKSCPKCGPNCRCGSICRCSHSYSGNCKMVKKGGSGCGSCGCPIGGVTYEQMNKFGGANPGSYPNILDKSVIIEPPSQNGSSMILGTSQNGGNFFNPIGAMPGAFTGSAWEANKLPGADGISSNRNFLQSYAENITNDPALKMSMNDSGYNTMNSKVGGYRYNKKHSASSPSLSKKGGGFVPQDLVNLGRDFTHNFQSAYNSLNGFPVPVDPAPYKDQLSGTLNNNSFML